MYHFTVDDFQAAESCIKCCCEKLSLTPGTTSKVSLGYAAWAVPIGQLYCTPQFSVEPMVTCPLPQNGAPVVTDAKAFSVAINTHLSGDLNTKVTDPDAQPLTFKVLPLYAPKHGTLVLNPDGSFDYDPAPNFKGEERFYVSASDGTNTTVFEVMIAVGIPAAGMVPSPHVSVGTPTVDQRFYVASFPVTVSPAAQSCEVWRLTVLQAALDCDCTCFTRSDCFDVHIAKC